MAAQLGSLIHFAIAGFYGRFPQIMSLPPNTFIVPSSSNHPVFRRLVHSMIDLFVLSFIHSFFLSQIQPGVSPLLQEAVFSTERRHYFRCQIPFSFLLPGRPLPHLHLPSGLPRLRLHQASFSVGALSTTYWHHHHPHHGQESAPQTRQRADPDSSVSGKG